MGGERTATEADFWKTRSYDFNASGEKELHTKLEYVRKNPIARGLA